MNFQVHFGCYRQFPTQRKIQWSITELSWLILLPIEPSFSKTATSKDEIPTLVSIPPTLPILYNVFDMVDSWLLPSTLPWCIVLTAHRVVFFLPCPFRARFTGLLAIWNFTSHKVMIECISEPSWIHEFFCIVVLQTPDCYPKSRNQQVSNEPRSSNLNTVNRFFLLSVTAVVTGQRRFTHNL